MKREIVITKDGSHTIAIPEMAVTYHSIHGAIQESMHVFITEGLRYIIDQSTKQPIRVFEMGFGTALNTFLTAIEAEKNNIQVIYTTVEQFPLSVDEANSLNYVDVLHHQKLFQQLHEAPWNEEVIINKHFTIHKIHNSLINLSTDQLFNIIYYDAFAPSAQPELWTKEIFEKLFAMLEPNGFLVTYCSKGDVRRNMIAAGLTVKKLPGPPGKREMLRATKA
jgi:tRNA U34 5-methylaminomethyl-2-thiouridine-forming methyltransferase MnmC